MLAYFGRGDGKTAFDHFVSTPPRVVAVDTETVSTTDRTLLGIGVAIDKDTAFYVTPDEGERFWRVIEILRDSAVKTVYHNAPFDLRVLREYKVDYRNIDDTAIMARLKYGWAVLEDVAMRECMIEVESAGAYLDRYGAKDMRNTPSDALAQKCAVDATATYAIWETLWDDTNPEYYSVEIRVASLLEKISQRGLRLDQERREFLHTYYTREKGFLLEIARGMGFNPGSPQQVGFILQKRHNFLPLTKGKRALKTDDAVLRKLNDPVAGMVILYRLYTRLIGNYLEPWRGVMRAYTTMHMDAITGRVSSSNAGKLEPDRNLMNVPKKAELPSAPYPVRSCIVPDADVMTRMDVNQIELRVLAYLSGDKNMSTVYATEGGDIHAETMTAMSAIRDIAKTFNFAMVYLGSASTIADHLGTSDIGRVHRYMQAWLAHYDGAAKWMTSQTVEGIRAGYVETMYGRRMPIPFERGENHARSCCVNYPVQGTAAEIFKRMMLECEDLLDDTLLPIHDEYLFDGDQRSRLDVEALSHVSPIYTPVEIDVMSRWGEKA